jgi:MFS transporter, PPP family, 3-phenylpropionic acid transporter
MRVIEKRRPVLAVAMANEPDERRRTFSALVRFVVLFSLLYVALGAAAPFLPAFLAARGLSPEQIGLLVALGNVVRLAANPVAGALTDLLQARRQVLALCLAGAAVLAFALVPAHGFLLLLVLSLLYAAALAPTTTLADALALRNAVPDRNAPARFEYGWVRGAGSAAFIVGVLVSGQAVNTFGPAAALAGQGLFLAGALGAALLVPAPRGPAGRAEGRPAVEVLIRNRPFRRLVLVAAIVLGSHTMHDTFAMIAWNAAGISAATGSILWSASVLAEVVVFFLIGPWLLRRIRPQTAMTIAVLAAVVRWVVLAQTANVLALALVEPLHGLTFALLHLACMRILVRVTPAALAATAQAIYAFGLALTAAVLTLASGFLYAALGAAGFLAMAVLALAALPAIWALRRSLDSAETPPP